MGSHRRRLCYRDRYFWLVRGFGHFPHPCECLLDHYAETDSLGAPHTRSTHKASCLTKHTLVICQMSLVADRLVLRPEGQTNGTDLEREESRDKQILWLNCSFSIAFVQYRFKGKKKKKKKVNFYFISQSSRWGQLYRAYRVYMALRHLIVGLPNSFCK